MKKVVVWMAAAAMAGCAAEDPAPKTSEDTGTVVAGAGYTTFDATALGCNDSPNGVDCNNYASKDKVYMSGGPVAGGLSDGQYYFSVLTPGAQNGGFVDGSRGNLSDTTAGGTTGDVGIGDASDPNRVFTISGGVMTYTGSHATGTSPKGKLIVQLMPYDDTDNAGGVYILAICQVGATSSHQCKYDAFRVAAGSTTTPFSVVSGGKYYDSNTNGVWDSGEAGIPGWSIDYHDGVSGTIITDASGTFSVQMTADDYVFAEEQGLGSVTLQNGGTTPLWHQTGNQTSQLVVTGGASATLNGDMTYDVDVIDGSTVSGVYFGNVCLGKGGGLTLGFWSNKNGQALITAGDLASLDLLNLRNANGSSFDPASKTALRNWLLNATATNMAYMLSAQLATMSLNVYHGFVGTSALVYAPGTTSANAMGFATIGALLVEANTSLGVDGNTVSGDPERTHQEALKNALDNANNDKTFVAPNASSCGGTPVMCGSPF